MKTLVKTIALLASFFVAGMALAATPNDSDSFNTLYVSDAALSSTDWTNSVTISEGELLSFELHYYLQEGVSAQDMRFSLENLNGRTYQAGESETVTGTISADNLSDANGSVQVHFADDVRLDLYNVSWQKYPCSSVGCEESLVDSYTKVLTSSGMSIGNVSGNDSHYTGNVIISFKVSADNSGGNYDDCYLDGVTVDHGDSYRFYSRETTTNTCSAYDLMRTCNDGDLSGSDSYRYATCDVISEVDAEVDTLSATNVDEDSARLRGEWEGDDNIDVWFAFDEHDSTPSCNAYSQRVGRTEVDDNDDFSHRVYGLDEDERYYFRACGEDSDGDVISGSIRSFTTDEEDDHDDNDEIDITTLSAHDVDEDSARLRGEMEGDDDIDVWFAFDEHDSTPSCNAYSQRVGRTEVDDNDDFSHRVYGLDEDERYYFRACGEDANGDIESGRIRTFTTDKEDDEDEDDSDVELRAVTNIASGISTVAARFNAYVFGEGDANCYFQFGRTASLGLTTSGQQIDLDDTSTCSLYRNSLSPNTTYYYRVVLEQDGEYEYGSIRSFRTDRVYTSTNPGNTNTNITIVGGSNDGDLDLTKWVSAENDPRFDDYTEAQAGETVYYKVRVENNTDEDLDDLEVTDRIPYYLELDTDRASDDDEDKIVRWVIDLDEGDSRTFITQMRVREDARKGDIIVSYASAENDEYSANSNDVEIEVEDGVYLEDEDEDDAAQGAFLFGALGCFPDSFAGWGWLILILLAIWYLISRIIISRNENARVLAELEAARRGSTGGTA